MERWIEYWSIFPLFENYIQHKIWSDLCSQEWINRKPHFSRVLLYEPIMAAPFPDPEDSIYYTQRKLSSLAPLTPSLTWYFIIWQEKVSPQKMRRRKGRIWRMGRSSSPGKNPALQWWWTTEAKVSRRYYVNYQDSQAMLWWLEHLKLCGSPQPPMSLVIFLPSNHPWGGFFLFLLYEEKKSSRNSMSLPNSHVPAPSAKEAGSRDVACLSAASSPTLDAEQTSSNCLLFRSVKRLTLSSSLIVPPFQGHHLKQQWCNRGALHP